MKRHIYKYLSLGMLFVCASAHADDTGTNTRNVASSFFIRSQGFNAVRRVIGTVDKENIYGADGLYWNLSLTPEYTRSFDEKEIARSLFGDALCDGRVLKIEGSQACNRDSNALLADYFYLPTDFKSEVIVKPRIQNFLVDLNFYLGLDNVTPGLYCWLQAPLVWTKWNLNYNERIINPGVNSYAAGYFAPGAIAPNLLLQSFSQYTHGNAPGTPQTTANTLTQFIPYNVDITIPYTTSFAPLNCARFCTSRDEITRIAEARFALGYNFLLDEEYHLGVNLQASAPTGNRLDSNALFGPQNGNGKHWELGAGLTGHYVFWKSENEEKQVGFYADLNVSHLFKARESRCFDLCGKPLSRYMLAEEMIPTNTLLNLRGDGTSPAYTFNQSYAPVANITQTDVNISVAIQADLVFWLNYTCGGWSFDGGYNLWVRSCEKINLLNACDQCTTFTATAWALKGDAQVFGFMNANDTGGTLLHNNPVALSATQSEATIYYGTNLGADASCPSAAQVSAAIRNPNVDNPELATAGIINVPLNSIVSGTPAANQISTSIQPVLIAQDNINYARTKGLTNKLFYNATYTWLEHKDWTPYIGWGGEIEWGPGFHNSCNECNTECESDCNTSCDTGCNTECDSDCDSDCEDTSTSGSCIRTGLSQWGIWARFGIAYS